MEYCTTPEGYAALTQEEKEVYQDVLNKRFQERAFQFYLTLTERFGYPSVKNYIGGNTGTISLNSGKFELGKLVFHRELSGAAENIIGMSFGVEVDGKELFLIKDDLSDVSEFCQRLDDLFLLRVAANKDWWPRVEREHWNQIDEAVISRKIDIRRLLREAGLDTRRFKIKHDLSGQFVRLRLQVLDEKGFPVFDELDDYVTPPLDVAARMLEAVK